MAASDIRAGRAFVELSLRNNLVRGLRQARQQLKDFGASVTNIGARMTALAGAASLPFIGAVKAASDLEETMNKFNVVFGDNAKAVKEWGDGFANEVGRSKKQIADFMAGSQDLFVPLGFEAGAATELSKQITGLSLDLASFNNMADEDVLRDLHAALTGSGEVMKKYGVIVSEAAVKQELLNQGIDPKKVTEQQKVQARLNIIMRGTTAAQGDAIRSAGGFANQMKRLHGVFMDAAAELGTALLPSVTELVNKAVGVVKVIGQWVAENHRLVLIVAAVVTAIGAAGVAFIALGAAISSLGVILGAVATTLSVVGAALGALLTPFGAITAALAAGAAYWLMYSEAGQNAVGSIGVALGNLVGEAQGAFGAIANAMAAGDMQAAADVLWSYLQLQWERGTAYLGGKWDEFVGFFQDIWASAVYNLASVMTTAWSGLQSFWNNFTTGLLAGWEMFTNAAINAWKWLEEMVAKGIAWITSWFDGTDYQTTAQNITDDYARQRGNRDAASQKRLAEMGDANARRAAEINSANAGAQAALKGDFERGVAARQSNRQAGVTAAEQRLADAQAKFAAAQERANAAGNAAPEAAATQAAATAATQAAVNAPTSQQLSKQTFGTFSAAALAAGGGSSPMDRAARAAEKTNEKMDELITVNRQTQRAVEMGGAIA